VQRKKSWEDKVEIVRNSFLRSSKDKTFAAKFYDNLFFLNPKISSYFMNTDFDHQRRALMNGLEFLIGFLDETDEHSRKQIIRLAKTHSADNLNIHPHHYYYWIDALVMTASELDPDWKDDFQYYWREVIHFPVSFMISFYYKGNEDMRTPKNI
jgi:hemoglobin-like flavoprotein